MMEALARRTYTQHHFVHLGMAMWLELYVVV
eukprot:COSAG06_NODE_6118_length_3100_cov_3.380746_1_plen_31_part_00